MSGTTRLTGGRKALLLISGLALVSLVALGVSSWVVTRSDLGCVRQNVVTLEPAPLEPGEIRADAPEQAIAQMEFPPALDVPPPARRLVAGDDPPENGIIRGDPPGPGDDIVGFDVFVSSHLHAKVTVSNYGENGWMVSGYRWCG
jgi:hypothetical protein